jgi:hypothetical protein
LRNGKFGFYLCSLKTVGAIQMKKIASIASMAGPCSTIIRLGIPAHENFPFAVLKVANNNDNTDANTGDHLYIFDFICITLHPF